MEMIQNIRKEFKTMLGDYDWMDPISKQSAIEKVIKNNSNIT